MEKDLQDLMRIVTQQEERKANCINLIASENIISNRVRELQATLLSNRYILNDFPNNKGLFEVKEKLKNHLQKMFGAKYSNISPLSGMSCMQLIMSSLTKKNDVIYTIDPLDGGHGSTEKVAKMNHLTIKYLPFDYKNFKFLAKEAEEQFKKHPPKLIYLDNTIICFYSKIDALVKLAHKYKAPLVYDGSHVLGLIAGKAFRNPLIDGADILNGSTHKTFFGTQKGIILTSSKVYIEKINATSNDYISSVHTGSLLALYMSVIEMEKYGKKYAKQVVKNARALGKSLAKYGVKIPTIMQGVTDTHQVWIDTEEIEPLEAFKLLADANINTNPIRIPSIRRVGLRLGTAEVTRLGMTEKDMDEIAKYIAEVLKKRKKPSLVQKDVINFCTKFKKIHFTLDSSASSAKHSRALENQKFSMHELRKELTPDEHLFYAEAYVLDVFNTVPEFEGMIVRGGVGRGTADTLSDIDFTCVFKTRDIDSIIRKYKLKKGMHTYKGLTFSSRYISLKEFENSDWSPKMKHAYSFVKQIQTSQKVSTAIAKNTLITDAEQRHRLCKNIIELGEICKVFDEYKKFKMFSEIYKQFTRGDQLSAHMEIDRAVKYIKNIVFDLNKIHYPEDKSYYTEFFTSLSRQPKNFDNEVKNILLMSRSRESFFERLSLVTKLAKKTIIYAENCVSLPENIYSFYLNTK